MSSNGGSPATEMLIRSPAVGGGSRWKYPWLKLKTNVVQRLGNGLPHLPVVPWKGVVLRRAANWRNISITLKTQIAEGANRRRTLALWPDFANWRDEYATLS
jgi:hypothetical protein